MSLARRRAFGFRRGQIAEADGGVHGEVADESLCGTSKDAMVSPRGRGA